MYEVTRRSRCGLSLQKEGVEAFLMRGAFVRKGKYREEVKRAMTETKQEASARDSQRHWDVTKQYHASSIVKLSHSYKIK
jgi:hypothetical protein